MKLYKAYKDIFNEENYYIFTDIKSSKVDGNTFNYYIQFENILGELSNMFIHWATKAGINRWLQDNKYETI